jgi:hypothetical protein
MKEGGLFHVIFGKIFVPQHDIKTCFLFVSINLNEFLSVVYFQLKNFHS